MAYQKKVDPQVQSYYDSLTDEQKADLDKRIYDAGRRLCDMRWSKSTKTLDQRLLIPRAVRVAAGSWKRTVNEKIQNGEPLTRRERYAAFGKEGLSTTSEQPVGRQLKGEKLPEGKDIAAYIRDSLGDGRALADFYIELLSLSAIEARKRGVFMNHKLMAAAWLGDRGWGKAKGDENEKGITVTIVNHSDVNVPERPAIAPQALEAVQLEDNDAGRDVDVTTVEVVEEKKQLTDATEIDLEDYSLRE